MPSKNKGKGKIKAIPAISIDEVQADGNDAPNSPRSPKGRSPTAGKASASPKKGSPRKSRTPPGGDGVRMMRAESDDNPPAAEFFQPPAVEASDFFAPPNDGELSISYCFQGMIAAWHLLVTPSLLPTLQATTRPRHRKAMGSSSMCQVRRQKAPGTHPRPKYLLT